MTWKEQLANNIPKELASEIELFESQILLRSQGKIDEKVFAETRLRRGVYGQRYDNGQRNDGTGTGARATGRGRPSTDTVAGRTAKTSPSSTIARRTAVRQAAAHTSLPFLAVF